MHVATCGKINKKSEKHRQPKEYLGIQEWTKEHLWKTAFKKI